MKYDSVVIGAGLGGLVTSALLAKSGWKVLVLEQHSMPGGYCTSYRRKGFVFDIPSVLSEVGNPAGYPDLAELGLYDAVEFRPILRFARMVFPDREIRLPANDLEGCRTAYCEGFPGEQPAVNRVFDHLVRLERRMGALQTGCKSISHAVQMALGLFDLVRLSQTSFYDYCRRFTNDDRLISALGGLWGYVGLPPKSVPASGYLVMLAMCLARPMYFPRGGYQVIPDFLVKRLQSDGGEIRYRSEVARIVVDGDRACGVVTTDGERIDCQNVVSNADTRRTLTALLDESARDRRMQKRAARHTPSPSGFAIQCGVDMDLSEHDVGYGQVFVHESWDADSFFERAMAAPLEVPSGPVQYGLQASSLLSDRLTPPGKNVVHIRMFPTDSASWRNLRGGPRASAAYRERKNAIATALIDKANFFIPGLSDSLVVTDVCTPPTFERYTSATDGAWYDRVGGTGRPAVGTPIRNLTFTGTKAGGSGGLPVAVAGGIAAAHTLLRSQSAGGTKSIGIGMRSVAEPS